MSDVKTPAGRAALLAVCDATTPDGGESRFCRGCGRDIDPTLCWCGDGRHPYDDEGGHPFVPMGCECLRHREPAEAIAMLRESIRALVEFANVTRTALPEAIEYIERLEREREVLNKALDVAERELADTRKANEILEAAAVADLKRLAGAAHERECTCAGSPRSCPVHCPAALVRFGPGPEVVDAAEDEARRRGRARRRK